MYPEGLGAGSMQDSDGTPVEHMAGRDQQDVRPTRPE